MALPASAAVLTGPPAYGDWRTDAPGVVRKITVADMPKTGTSPIGVAPPSIDARPAGAELKTLPGFQVSAFAKLEGPRLIRVAPNGDIFVSEGDAGRIMVLRAAPGADKADTVSTFAEGLPHPFGIAFYPLGPNPQWVYVANTNSVVRFAYRNGDLKARGAPETRHSQAHPDPFGPLDARHPVLAGRQAHVRVRGLRLERRRGHAEEDRRRSARLAGRSSRWAPRGASRSGGRT